MPCGAVWIGGDRRTPQGSLYMYVILLVKAVDVLLHQPWDTVPLYGSHHPHTLRESLAVQIGSNNHSSQLWAGMLTWIPSTPP